MIGSENMVRMEKNPTSKMLNVVYFQDINQSWPFYTSRLHGLPLLANLVRECSICLIRNKELMLQNNNSIELEKEGKEIYRNKPTFKRTRNSTDFGDAQFVTWSQEEYANLGLQRQYLKLKSYQRFTEAWSLLERADARGLFDPFFSSSMKNGGGGSGSGGGGDDEKNGGGGGEDKPIVLRIASVGGGPGFELYACQKYFQQKKYKNLNREIRLELTSMDYEKTWGEYARLMGYRFIHYDLKKGNLLHILGYQPGELHFVIFSAVMEM